MFKRSSTPSYTAVTRHGLYWQAGLFLVEAFPGHCDCLALGNILAKKQGKNGALDDSCQPTSSEEKSETCCA